MPGRTGGGTSSGGGATGPAGPTIEILLGNATSDDTAAIQAAIDQAVSAGGGIVRGKPGQSYTISRSVATHTVATALVISGSKVTIDMRGCTITLAAGSNCNMIQTPAVSTGTGGARLSDVSLIGGLWDRGANSGALNGLHTIVLYKVDRPHVEGLRVSGTAGKYAIYLVDCADGEVKDTHFPSYASDGVHLGGSNHRITITNTSGTTLDDLAVILGKDNPNYLFGDESDCTDILFDGIFPNAVDTNAFKVLGGNGITMKRITARNIKGTMTGGTRTQAAVWIGDDNAFSQMVGGQLESILVEDVEVAINKSSVPMVKINNTLVQDVVTLRDLKIVTGDSLGRVVQVIGLVNTLEVDGVSGAPATIADAHVVQISDGVTTASCKRLVARRLDVTWPSVAGSLVAARTAGHTLDKVIISDSAPVNVFQAVDSATTTEVDLSNVSMSGATQSINVRATGAVTVRASGSCNLPSAVAITAGGTLASKSFGFACDVTKLTASTGDVATNTVTTGAIGAGPVTYYGGAWVPLNTAARAAASPKKAWRPAGVLNENFSRLDRLDPSASAITGRLILNGGMVLAAGVTVSSIKFEASSTAGAGLTHCWFCLVDQATLAVLAKTVDDASATWAANTAKTLAIGTDGANAALASYTPTADKLVYVGICVTGTTTPNLYSTYSGPAGSAAMITEAPILSGSSDIITGGLVANCPATVSAPAGSTNNFYAAVL